MRRIHDREGATAVEYSILAAAIAAVIVVVVFAMGRQTCEHYRGATASIAAEMSGGSPPASCP